MGRGTDVAARVDSANPVPKIDTGDPAETSSPNDAALRTDVTLGCASADEANARKTKLSNRTRAEL